MLYPTQSAPSVSDTSIPPPVDLCHLALQTGGDESLAREALSLFLTKAEADLDAISKAPDATVLRRVAHGLLGSARAVGAVEVARLAATLERDGDSRVLAALAAATEEARRFIAGHLVGG